MNVVSNKLCSPVASPMTAQPMDIKVPRSTIGEMWPNYNTMTQEFRWVRWWAAAPMLMFACDLSRDGVGMLPDAVLPVQILQHDYGRVMTKVQIVNGKKHNYWGLSGSIPAGQFGVVIKDDLFSSSEKFLANLFCVFDGFPEIICLREYDLDFLFCEDFS